MELESNQPTVGRQIDALEKSLGIKLFQRSVKGLSLTQEGLSIYEQSRKIEYAMVKLQRTLLSEKEDISGRIILSAPEGLAHEILMPALPQFYEKYPNVKLTINISANTANLTRGEADIAIRLFRPKEADLVVKKLGIMRMGLFASAGYQSQFGLPKTTQELQHHSIITYSESLRHLPENQWLLQHSNPARHILSSDSTMSRLNATKFNIGISIQPLLFAQSQTELIRILKKTNIPSHDVWLVYHKDLRHLSRLRVVIDFLTQQLSEAILKVE